MSENHRAAPFPLRTTRVVTDLDAMDDVAAYILVGGREIAVHHLDAIAYRALRLMQASAVDFDVLTLYDAVERACPDLPRAEIDAMSAVKIGRILALAEGGVKEVQESENKNPNVDGPTGATPMMSSPPA
jgi:hypothetical protein